MNKKNRGKKNAMFAAIVAAFVIGGVGGTLVNAVQTNAQTPTTAPAAKVQSAGTTAKSNEDATHEAKESPEREAQEDAGKVEHQDSANEANEAPGTETNDDATQAPANSPTTK